MKVHKDETYPDGRYSIKDERLKILKKYILLGNVSGKRRYFWCPVLVFNILVTVTQVVQLYQVWGDLDKMMGVTATFLIQFQATYKLGLLFWQAKKINKLLGIVENDFWDFSVSNLESKISNHMKWVTRLLCLHLSESIFGAVLFMTFPLTKYPPGTRQLPIQSWFPFDTNPSPLHEFLYVTLSVNGIGCIIMICIYDFYFVYFAQHLLAQFELLKDRLECLTDNVINMDDDLYKVHSQEFQKEIYRRLSVCVEHHSKLLSFGREIEDFSSVNIALQMFVSMATFVIIGFILSTDTEDLVKSFKLAVYFWGISLQLAIFALHGSELQYQSSSVASAAYLCGWHLGAGRLRRGLMFLQMNAHKEIKVSAVGCIDLDNNTLILVYRTAFSCVTLLQSLSEE